MREARTCYDHLAGRLAVGLFECWVAAGVLRWQDDEAALTRKGRAHLAALGIDVDLLERERRPLCRTCIDWSERKNHLGGSIGAAVLSHMIDEGWATRAEGARALYVSLRHERAFVAWYEGTARLRFAGARSSG